MMDVSKILALKQQIVQTDALTKTNNDLKKQVEQKDARIRELESKVKKGGDSGGDTGIKDREIKRLEEEASSRLRDWDKKEKKLLQKVEDSDELIQQLRGQIKQAEATKKKLRSDLEANIAEKDVRIRQLKDELFILRGSQDDSVTTDLQRQLESKDKQVEILENKMETSRASWRKKQAELQAKVEKKDQAIRKLNAELAKKVMQKSDKGVQVDSAKRQPPAQPSSVSLAKQQLEKLKAETLAESMKAKNSKYLSFAPPRTPKRIKISFSQYGKCSGESSRQVPNIFTG